MTIEPKRNPYDGSGHDADRDAATVAELLAIIVEEGCNLDRTGMTEQQVAATNRIDVLAILARDIAERVSEGVFGVAKAA
jgi:hypothetical protein